jgi:hypothetical protein
MLFILLFLIGNYRSDTSNSLDKYFSTFINSHFEHYYIMMNGVLWDVTLCGSCKNRISEQFSASFIRMTRIGEVGKTPAVTNNRRATCIGC